MIQKENKIIENNSNLNMEEIQKNDNSIDLSNVFKENKYFDIKEMIRSFSFDDLIKRNYIGAVLFFTNKQYVISYTENHDKGYHDSALAHIYKDIHGGGKISKEEYNNIIDKIKNYMNAKMFFYKDKINVFFTGLDNLNTNNFNSFSTFYSSFNGIFKILGTKYDLNITFFDQDKNTYVSTNNLYILYNYLENHLYYDDKIDDEDEIIIGIPNNNKTKKRF